MLTLTKPRKKKETVIKTKKKTPMDKYRWGKRFQTHEYGNSPIDQEAIDQINDYYKQANNCVYKQTHVDSIAILETLLLEQDNYIRKYHFSVLSKISIETSERGFNIQLKEIYRDEEEEGTQKLALLICECIFKPNYRRVYKIGIVTDSKYKTLFNGSIECQRTALQLPSNEIIPT